MRRVVRVVRRAVGSTRLGGVERITKTKIMREREKIEEIIKQNLEEISGDPESIFFELYPIWARKF